MSNGRKYNFNGEQCTLPVDILKKVESEWNNCQGVGVTMLEMFNKQPKYLNFLAKGEESLRKVMNIPKEFKIYYMHGGQALQIAAVPLNFLGQNDTATYLNTGYWSERAIDEAKKYVPKINVISTLQSIPGKQKITISDQEPLSASTAYIHYVSDEPVEGIALNVQPKRSELAPNAIMVADLSADFLTREVDWSQLDAAYISSEYQIGIAGSILLVIRESAIKAPHPQCPYMIDYAALKATDGLPNTPPTFPMYMNAQFFIYAESIGGVEQINKKINTQARRIYAELDAHPLVYQNRVEEQYRSNCHIIFQVLGVQQDQHFLEEAEKKGIIGLSNRKSETLRISLGLGTTDEAVDALVSFLSEYASKITSESLGNKEVI